MKYRSSTVQQHLNLRGSPSAKDLLLPRWMFKKLRSLTSSLSVAFSTNSSCRALSSGSRSGLKLRRMDLLSTIFGSECHKPLKQKGLSISAAWVDSTVNSHEFECKTNAIKYNQVEGWMPALPSVVVPIKLSSAWHMCFLSLFPSFAKGLTSQVWTNKSYQHVTLFINGKNKPTVICLQYKIWSNIGGCIFPSSACRIRDVKRRIETKPPTSVSVPECHDMPAKNSNNQ